MLNQKKTMPYVSVIMGVYNSSSAFVLERSIKSILNQSFFDFEFIICDDCSTKDFVLPVLKKMASIDSRIVLLSNNENYGLARTLNKCISIAKGKYIARQDDDDVSLPNRLLEEVMFLDSNLKYDLVGSNQLLMASGKVWGQQLFEEKPLKEGLLFGCLFSHPTIMFTRKLIDLVQGYSCGKYISRDEDYDLYCKMYENGLLGYNIQKVLYIYDLSLDTYKKQKLSHRIDEFHLRKIHFEKLGILKKHRIWLWKPLLSGILPIWVRKKIHYNRFRLSKKDALNYESEFLLLNDFYLTLDKFK